MSPLQNLFLVADADNPHSAAFERTRALALATAARVHCAAFPYASLAAYADAQRAHKAREAQLAAALRAVEQQARYLRDTGIEATARATWAELPLADILDQAYRQRAQLLIKDVGQIGGMRRLLVSPLDLELLRRGRLPLLLVAEGARVAPRRVLAAVDVLDAPATLNAALVERAAGMARCSEAELQLVHVGAPLPLPQATDAVGQAAAQALAADIHGRRAEALDRLATAAGLPPRSGHLLEGAAAATLRDFAVAQRIGLIVLASANRARSDRPLMGQVAEAILAQAPCSLLVLPVEALTG